MLNTRSVPNAAEFTSAAPMAVFSVCSVSMHVGSSEGLGVCFGNRC